MRHLLGVFLVLLLFSCRKDPTSWDVEFYAPVASGRLDLSDLFADSLLGFNSEGLAILSAEVHLGENWLDTLSSIPDTLVRKSFTTGLPISILVPPGVDFITQNGDSRIASGEVQLKQINVKSGILNYTLRSYISGELNYSYRLPGTTIGGDIISLEGIATPGSATDPFSSSGQIDLSGASIDLTGSSGLSFNALASSLDISTTENFLPGTQLFGFDSLTIDMSFQDIELDYARGFFGVYELDESSSEELQFLSSIVAGSFNPEAISLNLYMENSLGVDMQFKVESITGSNSGNGNAVSLSSAALDQSYNLTRAFDLGSEVQVNDVLDFNLDQNNSNILDFIALLPDQVEYSASVTINPLGDISSGNDFLYTNRLLDPVLSLEVPMCFSAGGLTLRDTIAIESGFEEIDFGGILSVITENGFPFSASLDLSIINPNGEQLLSFGNQSIFSGASLNDDGLVDSSAEQLAAFELSDEDIGAVATGNSFVIEIVFDTANNGEPIKLYESYFVDVSMIYDSKTTISYE